MEDVTPMNQKLSARKKRNVRYRSSRDSDGRDLWSPVQLWKHAVYCIGHGCKTALLKLPATVKSVPEERERGREREMALQVPPWKDYDEP